MSNDQPVLRSLTENATDVPVSAGQENYVLLLVLLSVFAGGTLVLLSLLLLFCHRCCVGGRRYSRASDDPEKTNTTYAEDSQPTQEITIRLEESDALSASSCHDGEPERFISTGSTGRRVSFNESTLYEQEKTTKDKGRRYTLTEGDFHHLKKARLTHLHLPPSPCDLKILTIMECDSTESSTLNINESAARKLPLSIYQPERRPPADWGGQSLSGGLPGDPHHSIILDRGPQQSSAMKALHARSQTLEALRDRCQAEAAPASGQTSVLNFLSKLRRHASLEGAGPYFRRWKFDTSNRAASLDAKGSPRRRPFQRQRAASETTDHAEDDSARLHDHAEDDSARLHDHAEDDSARLHDHAFQSFAQTPVTAGGLQSLSAETLSQPASAACFSRLTLEATAEAGGGSTRAEEVSPAVNGTGEELEAVMEADGRGSAEDDDLLGAQQEETSEETRTATVRKEVDMDDGDEVVFGAEGRRRTDSASSLSFLIRQESSEAPPSLYRDIWSLRASLEQYASSDQSSTDRESIRSDADSVSSAGGAGARYGLDSCLSQDLDDEPEGDGEGEGGTRGSLGLDREVGSGTAVEEGGNRKLLQMDSGYASIEAPSRAPEEMRLFGTPGAPRGKTASERRLFFTSSGRKGSVCESMEAKLFEEELEMSDGTETDGKLNNTSQADGPALTPPAALPHLKSLHPQRPPEPQSLLMSPLVKPTSQPSSPHRPRLRRRDYSIDEKTDALFNEFLRHDPRFDQQDSPLRSRHRSRVHLRKQWQRHKQYSDPGSSSGGRYSPSLERQRFTPLRRGDSAGYPLDTRYHSTLSRIASAADEEASEVAASEEAAEKRESNGAEGGAAESSGGTSTPRRSSASAGGRGGEGGTSSPSAGLMDPRVDNRNNNSSRAVLTETSPADLTDKLAASLEERLYGGLASTEKLSQAGSERVLAAARTASPGLNSM